MAHYDVNTYQDGKWWTFEIPELTSPAPHGGEPIVAMGQARHLSQVEREARELADTWTETEGSTVSVRVKLAPHIAAWVEQARGRETEGRAALEEAATLRREAANALLASGITQADAAVALGVSRQRVQQLVSH
jgi:predicted XRE-type DNA-binding protein